MSSVAYYLWVEVIPVGIFRALPVCACRFGDKAFSVWISSGRIVVDGIILVGFPFAAIHRDETTPGLAASTTKVQFIVYLSTVRSWMLQASVEYCRVDSTFCYGAAQQEWIIYAFADHYR